MAHDRRAARHARKITPLRRTLLGVVIATAAIAGIVGVGSLFTDSPPDDHVTLVPTPDQSAPDAVDDARPPEGAPSESPTTAATAGASPEPEAPDSDDPGGAEGSGGSGVSGPPGADSPSPDDPPSDEPSPPRATHPGESPRPDPEPTTPPDPSPSPTSDPTSDPDPDPTSDPDPDPTASPTLEPEPGISCTAVATALDASWFEFDASVTITNTSNSPVLGWRSSFTLPSGYRAESAQNADLVESGNSGVVSGTDMIGPGQSLTYEISGPAFTSAGPPSAITLNDKSCS